MNQTSDQTASTRAAGSALETVRSVAQEILLVPVRAGNAMATYRETGLAGLVRRTGGYLAYRFPFVVRPVEASWRRLRPAPPDPPSGGMRVLLIAGSPSAAERIGHHHALLARLGWPVSVAGVDDEIDAGQLLESDAVVLHRAASERVERVVELVGDSPRPILFDAGDLEIGPENVPASRKTVPSAAGTPDGSTGSVALSRVAQARCDAIICSRSSASLIAERLGKPVYVLADEGGDETAAGRLADALLEAAAGKRQLLAGKRPDDLASRRPLRINWLICRPFEGSGGHTTLFRLVRHLAYSGHLVRVYHEDPCPFGSNTAFARFVLRSFGDTGAQFSAMSGPFADADVTIATQWRTASVVADRGTGEKVYFVQDFEPFFYPMGSEYLAAEQTYRLGMHHVVLGPWLAGLLRERYRANAAWVPFACDHDVYRPAEIEGRSRPPRVVFYARPTTPRRCFELATRALALVQAARPDVEVVLFGARRLPDLPAGLRVMNRGVLTPAQLAGLYSSVQVGLTTSPTNCSLVPLEMMACGCAVVDLATPTVEGTLVNGLNCLLAEPTPERIAEALLSLLNEPERRAELTARALAWVRERTWATTALEFERELYRVVTTNGRQPCPVS